MVAKPKEDLQKAHRRRKNRESFLETAESIVVAFVLAFVFRAFIVEAFVIPTGSMGPTLYGQHVEIACSDCGHVFAMGAEGRPTSEPICPNCCLPQRLPLRTPLYSGDRILVLKFLYDFEEPRRWDVIVFRNPNEPSENYIKRLVGLPGETLELVDGNMTVNGQMARKTDTAQDALWMLVHDTRARPTRRDWKPRWVATQAWDSSEAGFTMPKALRRDQIAWLQYVHRNGRNQVDNILDAYGYNSGIEGRMGANVCTDLGLLTEVTAGDRASVCLVEMRAYKDRFRFELTAEGSDQPARILLNDEVIAASAAGVLPVGRPVEVQVANVDHKLMLLVDGERVANITSAEVTAEGDIAYTPTALSEDERRGFDAPSGDDPRALAAEVRVGGRSGPLALGYLGLDRDVYYTNEMIRNGGSGPMPGHATQGSPLTLRAGEFFVCGDNSPKSFDSRLWFKLDRPVVPRRNLVGKAFFVYWPAAGERWHVPLPLLPDPTGWRLVH
ncbi:MAG TPA: signal peptidase I [Phycisphaerae bacterium]|nr:signal peptidase I [Phycisphaerae bacterium]